MIFLLFDHKSNNWKYPEHPLKNALQHVCLCVSACASVCACVHIKKRYNSVYVQTGDSEKLWRIFICVLLFSSCCYDEWHLQKLRNGQIPFSNGRNFLTNPPWEMRTFHLTVFKLREGRWSPRQGGSVALDAPWRLWSWGGCSCNVFLVKGRRNCTQTSLRQNNK